ncbi:MAG: hypothetical protein NDI69_05765 [Bacteriovoracaceae bacterium]|nr:hypothetical protein [Bacteriovoracaceae bacterium]
MEVSKPVELTRISEIKILHNVRLINRHDLNPIYSKENLRVQFDISGEIKGAVTCYLCLDGHELEPIEKNYIFPLFVESMNILIGRQLTMDEELNHFRVNLSAPKLSMISKELNTSLRSLTQKYELELEGHTFNVLTEYNLSALN